MKIKLISFIKKQIVFLKYIMSSGISFIIDISIFTVCNDLLLKNTFGDKSILISTFIARAISSLANYFMNRNEVFNIDHGDVIDIKTFIKYYILVAIQLCVSGLSVFLIHEYIDVDATLIKIPIDIIIFVINYFIQKYLIFKESEENYEVKK